MHDSFLPRATWLVAGLAFLAGSYAVLSFPVHHDAAWLLYAAARVLDGAVLYHDLVEVNPPLIVWLMMVPELLARVTGGWAPTLYRALVLVLAGWSLGVSARLLRPRLEPVAWSAAVVVLAALLVAVPGYDFGQREHLSVLLVLPWLLLVGSGSGERSAGARAALGVAAGIGFALKPFFLAAWVFALLRVPPRSLRRAEHVAVFSTLVVYGLAVLVLARDYFPLARLAATAYGGYSQASLPALLRVHAGWLALAALAAWLLLRRRLLPEPRTGDVLALALAGFLLAVLAQRKGWGYHWLPSTLLAWLLLGVLAAQAGARALARLGRAGAVVLPSLALVLALGLAGRALGAAGIQREAMTRKAFRLPELMQVVARHGRGGPIAALSTNLQAGFPLVNIMETGWGLRFNSLFLLPGVYAPNPPGTAFPYRPPAEMPAPERYQYDAVLEDLLRERPTVLIVDRMAPGYLLHGFNYLEYFAQDPRFVALLREYREFPPVERYRILVRTQ